MTIQTAIAQDDIERLMDTERAHLRLRSGLRELANEHRHDLRNATIVNRIHELLEEKA